MQHSNTLSQANSTSNWQLVQNRGGRVELINTEDISQILGLSRAHVVGRITKRPDFPAPVVNHSQRIRRWLRSDVESWILGGSKK
jgi:predicted DNA-binding transcriptional regulator AlpA